MHYHFQRDIKYLTTSFTRQTHNKPDTPIQPLFPSQKMRTQQQGCSIHPKYNGDPWGCREFSGNHQKELLQYSKTRNLKAKFNQKSSSQKITKTLKFPIRKKNINKNNDKLAKTMPNLYKHPENKSSYPLVN